MSTQNRSYIHIGKSIGNFDRCIIDVGCCYSAQKGKQLKQKYGVPGIFIDADKASLDVLRVSPEDLIIWAAISNRNGIAKFNIYQHEGTHSLCEVDMDHVESWLLGSRNSTKEEWAVKEINMVPMLTLADIIETLEIKSIAALKIDAQGHDFQVIKGLGGYIHLVDNVELEVQIVENELYKNSSKKDEVVDYMTQQKFKLVNSAYQSSGQEQNLYFER